MTREDLLKGNAAIAEEFGKNVKAYCPDVKHIVVIFNPADITGLITLLYSGLKPSQVTTLAALDSTRLRSELSKHFGIAMDKVENCRTYGGHGEQMAVYASTAKVNGKALLDIIGTPELTKEQWAEIQQKSNQRRCKYHQPARTFFFPKSVIRFHRNDCCRHGWKTIPLAGRHLCIQWQIRPHHDGLGNFHHQRWLPLERCERHS